MRDGLNLLPWRMALHKRRLRYFVYLCALSALFVTSGYWMWWQWKSNIQQQIQASYKQQEQLQKQLQQTYTQLQQLRQNSFGNDVQIISHEQVWRVLSVLAELPLEQGELSKFHLREGKVVLQGAVENQREFEQFHHALIQVPLFENVELKTFQPDTALIQFQFELQLKEKAE